MSILIVLRSRIWICFISDHCSTIFMFYIFTSICCQRVAIVLAYFFYHDGGFWFCRYVVFHCFVTIRCSMYCDIIVLILSWLYTFFILYLCLLWQCDIYFDVANILCISVLFGEKFGIQYICWTFLWILWMYNKWLIDWLIDWLIEIPHQYCNSFCICYYINLYAE